MALFKLLAAVKRLNVSMFLATRHFFFGCCCGGIRRSHFFEVARMQSFIVTTLVDRKT